MENLATQMSKSFETVRRYALIGALFFLMALSLGYPSLNRYRPGDTHLGDSQYYTEMVEEDIRDLPPNYWHFRILVPMLAKPFYWLAKGRVGTWDPTLFGLLVANALFVAATALVLMRIGAVTSGEQGVGFLTGLLFLCQFNVTNLYLAGLVDSAEVFLMVTLIWTLMKRRWLALPLLGVVGGFAKETYIVFATIFAGSWFVVSEWRSWFRPLPLAAICAMAMGGLVTISLLRHAIAPDWVQPWNLGKEFLHFDTDIPSEMISLIFSRAFLYTFAWLLPLGLLGLRTVPAPWKFASTVTFFLVLLISASAPVGANVGRPLFAAAGPILLYGSAAFLWNFLRLSDRSSRPD